MEKCTKNSRRRNVQALRAVKQIDLDTRFGSIDYNRELEAIAKFSHAWVRLQNEKYRGLSKDLTNSTSMCDALFGLLGGTKAQASFS